jgi:predicted kinase
LQCVIFIGIQASGKSTFFKENFFATHMRINLDMLKTRNRENIYLDASIKAVQPFVIDNTNPTVESRKKYISLARANRFEVIGYYFEPNYEQSIRRNETRSGKAKIPDIGIKSVLAQLEPPTYEEGFDKLYRVYAEDGEFVVNEFDNPVAKG